MPVVFRLKTLDGFHIGVSDAEVSITNFTSCEITFDPNGPSVVAGGGKSLLFSAMIAGHSQSDNLRLPRSIKGPRLRSSAGQAFKYLKSETMKNVPILSTRCASKGVCFDIWNVSPTSAQRDCHYYRCTDQTCSIETFPANVDTGAVGFYHNPLLPAMIDERPFGPK